MPGQAACRRRAIGGWRKTNIRDEALQIDALTSRLTQVAAYRQTICSVKASDYLLRRINGMPEPIVLAATQARGASVAAARQMIEQLHWSDFEVLVDLIFARGGWQRTTRLGETMADVDLVIEQTTLGETASLQIKSRASQGVLDAHIEMHHKSGRHHRTFFVCHTADTALSVGEHRDVHLWTGEFPADIAIPIPAVTNFRP